MMFGENLSSGESELKVSFGYQCERKSGTNDVPNEFKTVPGLSLQRNSRSFSCLSGAALSANATLANTNICNGLIGAEILPSWDSPNSFRRIPSSPSISSKVDILSSSLQSTLSNLSYCSSALDESPEEEDSYLKSMSLHSPSESFLNANEVQIAGGAAGEDRVQAVCSEEDGWLFCGIYDGFNGRDAADFLTGMLYDSILMNLNSLSCDLKYEARRGSDDSSSFQYMLDESNIAHLVNASLRHDDDYDEKIRRANGFIEKSACGRTVMDMSCSLKDRVVDSLRNALNQAETDFLSMVEQEMEERPDLVSVGSCVLVVLLLGRDLYTLNLGDSRAVLATYCESSDVKAERLAAVQLTDIHTTDNEVERTHLLLDHPDDPTPISYGKVKGKLKVTRAFGVGYLKQKKLNDALMGILRVRNLTSPPYVYTNPSVSIHRISDSDHFVIVASDGLFDFFTNEEAVELVHSYILTNPSGDPAKFLLEELVAKAAECHGFTKEELMNIPPGRRRKYHDDVTVMVITLGTKQQRASKASTCL